MNADVLQARAATPDAFVVTPAAGRVLRETGCRAVELFEEHLASDWSEAEVFHATRKCRDATGLRMTCHWLDARATGVRRCLVILSAPRECWMLASDEFEADSPLEPTPLLS